MSPVWGVTYVPGSDQRSHLRGKALRRGRPEVIPSETRHRLRACYTAHYGQWGPQVLAAWAVREELGHWSPTTIRRVIADLKPKPEPHRKPIRYEVTTTGAMWSEDGTGFHQDGTKNELLVAQDEHARFKVGFRLVDGPADEDAVYEYLKAAFEAHGAPLVLKHDGGKVFHGERIRALLHEYQVIELTSPPYYPCYNGKKERSVRDIKSYERAMRANGVGASLAERLAATIHDLNDVRPRPVLHGRTAREAFDQDRTPLPDRAAFAQAINRKEEELRSIAVTRHDLDCARRRAVEWVLLRHRLMQIRADVSTDCAARG